MNLTFIVSLSVKSYFNNFKLVQAEIYHLTSLILLERKIAKIMRKEMHILKMRKFLKFFCFVNRNLRPQNILVKALMIFFSWMIVLNIESEILFLFYFLWILVRYAHMFYILYFQFLGSKYLNFKQYST